MKIVLERFCYSPQGTFGDLIMPDGQILKTVERPWLNNEPSVSCIPVGTYDCRPRRYNRGGYEAVEVTGVEGRSYIMFHMGNTINDSAGCILVCSRHGCLNDQWAGLNSRLGFNTFMKYTANIEFTLVIKNVTNKGYIKR